MKTTLISIDAKYIHTNTALRYLKANTTYEASIIEFTIKDDVSFMLEKIKETHSDILGFSVYIWNTEIVKVLLKELQKESFITILGGPEVSFINDDDEFHFLGNYIVHGEGEIAFHRLLDSLHKNIPNPIIPGISFVRHGQVTYTPKEDIKDLNQLVSPYHFEEDYNNIPNKIQYVETSRGCPFSCSYCLASLENGVRYFSMDRVKDDLLFLMNKEAKTFKFLDRTFNANPLYTIELFQFIIDNYSEGMVFQFEITGDILKQEIIDFVNIYAPKNLFRFEIGIQSTFEKANIAVHRRQDNDHLFYNIKQLLEGDKVDLHLDLIAGLPYETLDLFKKTFNDVFTLYAKELQLGFLKMLKGTLLRLEADKYHYIYDAHAPYEIQYNQFLSKDDIDIIHQVEEMLEIFWNKGFMNETIQCFTEKLDSPFDFFYSLSKYLQKRDFNLHRYQLYDVFTLLIDYMKETYPEESISFEMRLKKDYLLYHPIKPKLWWDKRGGISSSLIEEIQSRHKEYPLEILFKYSVMIPYMNGIYTVLYLPTGKKTIYYQK